ncbi:MAG: copper resistance protein NlpE [Clostridiales bacterium]|nr:copper resistance protein NlpE [Clostridiales bacterium]
MKKMMALTLALLMLLSLAPALAEDVTGEWYLTQAVVGETAIDAAALGMEMTLVLNADGSMTLISAYPGEEANEETAAWALDGDSLVITADGETQPFGTFVEGRLEAEDGGAKMIFTREKPEAVPAAQPVAAESAEAFLGVWHAARVDMDGTVVPLDMVASMGLDISVALTVEEGKATAQISLLGAELPLAEYTAAFADGVLTLTAPEGAETTLTLYDDGSLSYILSLEEMMDLTLFLDQAE